MQHIEQLNCVLLVIRIRQLKALPAGLLTGLWFGFVLSGNIGGALTPLGSITILMSLEILNREGYPMSFLKYVKKMLPLTIACGVLGVAYSVMGW